MTNEPDTTHRSGFVSFVGRPNTGKSTLTNAMVGEKVAITSNRPQTTRRVIRGIVHADNHQIIIVDTPGLHRPRTLLGERLNALVKETYSDVDLIGLCIPVDEAIGPGDRWIVEQVRAACPRTTIIGIVTKLDKGTPDDVMKQLVAVTELLGPDSDVVPVGALDGTQLDVLSNVIAQHLPHGPQFYPQDMTTDEDPQVYMSELIREAALEGVRDELPHSIAVTIEEIIEREDRDDLVDVHAIIYVERPSQKSIIIGKKGERLKHIGAQSRAGIQQVLGKKIYLDLHVKVLKEWQRDPKQLGKLGF